MSWQQPQFHFGAAEPQIIAHQLIGGGSEPLGSDD